MLRKVARALLKLAAGLMCVAYRSTASLAIGPILGVYNF